MKLINFITITYYHKFLKTLLDNVGIIIKGGYKYQNTDFSVYRKLKAKTMLVLHPSQGR